MKRAPSRHVNRIFLIVGLVLFAYYLICGFSVRFGQSFLWMLPLLGALCLVRYILVRKYVRANKPLPGPAWLWRTLRACAAAGLALFIAVECMIVGAPMQAAPDGLDYIIILGAKVNGTQPSGALSKRIATAAEYLHRNPDCVAIASGGQGGDEGISEAQCIYEGLLARGIPPQRILLEDRATSTQENIQNSYAILPDGQVSIGVVTNSFHIFRAMRIARRHLPDGCSVYGVSAPTSAFMFPYYALREFLALMAQEVKALVGM